MKTLTLHVDGLEGVDIGIIDAWQHGISGGEIYRRPMYHDGSYGGWRWECSVVHVARYRAVPYCAAIQARIEELGVRFTAAIETQNS